MARVDKTWVSLDTNYFRNRKILVAGKWAALSHLALIMAAKEHGDEDGWLPLECWSSAFLMSFLGPFVGQRGDQARLRKGMESAEEAGLVEFSAERVRPHDWEINQVGYKRQLYREDNRKRGKRSCKNTSDLLVKCRQDTSKSLANGSPSLPSPPPIPPLSSNPTTPLQYVEVEKGNNFSLIPPIADLTPQTDRTDIDSTKTIKKKKITKKEKYCKALAEKYLAVFNEVFGRRCRNVSHVALRLTRRLDSGDIQPWQVLCTPILSAAQNPSVGSLRNFGPEVLLRDGTHPRKGSDGVTYGGTDWIDKLYNIADTLILNRRLTAIAEHFGLLERLEGIVARVSRDENAQNDTV